MLSTSPLGQFLQTCRSRANPHDRGLPTYPGRRRVAGLRREELAQLAGVSVSYYTSLEQGRAGNVSPDVLHAVAGGLGLDQYQEAHLLDLAAMQRRRPPARPRRTPERVDVDLAELLTTLRGVPALISGRSGDILAWNELGRALFTPHLEADAIQDSKNRPNTARLVFLDPVSRAFFGNWNAKAVAVVAHLHLAAGRHPEDGALAELIGELSIKSPEFARLWAGNDVRPCGVMTLDLRHPTIGSSRSHSSP